MMRFFGILLLVVILSVSGAIAQGPPITQDTVLTFVHDLLQVFYPELITKGNRLKLCVDHPADSSWREISGVYFTVAPESSPSGDFQAILKKNITHQANNPIASHAVLLDGLLWLPPRPGSRIQQLDIRPGSMVRKKYDDFVASVKAHPESTNDELVKNLNTMGARFGPDEKKALLTSVPWKSAERFLGKLNVTAAVFRLPNQERVGSFEAATMYWTIWADAHFQDGTDGHYAFTFEPFEGKLISIFQLGE